MTEPAQTAAATPADAVISAPAEPVQAASVVVADLPRAEDILPTTPPPTVVELSKENLAELIAGQQVLVDIAERTRDDLLTQQRNAQVEYETHATVLARLQALASQSGRVVITVFGG